MKAHGKYFLLILFCLSLALPAAAASESRAADAQEAVEVPKTDSWVDVVLPKNFRESMAKREDADMWPFGPTISLDLSAYQGLRADTTFLRYSTQIEDLSKAVARDEAAAIGGAVRDLKPIKMDNDFGFSFWLSQLILFSFSVVATVRYNRALRQRPSKVRKLKQGNGSRKEPPAKVLFMPKPGGTDPGKESA